jgi:DNA (cytosine-5)-methyltransferase 1
LFCGAGGASVGYDRAGFEVTGVDINPQPNYPFAFLQMDAMQIDFSSRTWTFDAIHASPPCQKYSSLQHLGKQDHKKRFDLIAQVRRNVKETRVPYVIENVVGAPLINPIMLCGSSFGLGVRRHRLFEVNFLVGTLPCQHVGKSIGVYGDHPQVSKGMNRARTLQEAQIAMGIDWMNWRELTQAIPPAYTEAIGYYLKRSLEKAS